MDDATPNTIQYNAKRMNALMLYNKRKGTYKLSMVESRIHITTRARMIRNLVTMRFLREINESTMTFSNNSK